MSKQEPRLKDTDGLAYAFLLVLPLLFLLLFLLACGLPSRLPCCMTAAQIFLRLDRFLRPGPKHLCKPIIPALIRPGPSRAFSNSSGVTSYGLLS
jgi:hypothetical protein